jgi:hypothetical protein
VPSDVNNDNDPEEVPSYVDTNGDIIWPAEADYDIADFDPDPLNPGSIYTELSATNQFHVITGENDLWAQYALHGPGVYYLDGNIRIHSSDAPPFDVELTLVVTGEISFHLEHDFAGWYPQSAPAVHRLALFGNGDGPSPSCVAKDVHVNSVAGQFTGIIFAPYGEAKFSTRSTESQAGCVIGYQTSISSSGASIICDPGETNNQGSINMTQ